jgi:PAS domain S-box-containing protein
MDRLTRLASRICEVPVALVSIVTDQTQEFIGRSGTDLAGTPRDHSFCAHAMHGDQAMEIRNACEDPRFADNPLVTGAPHIRFYAGQPLRSLDGTPLGSLCVIDDKPRPDGLSREQRDALATLADAAMAVLERRRLEHLSHAAERDASKALYELEQRFLVLADAIPHMVWSSPADGMSDYFNRVWCEFTGQPQEASFGSGWMSFLHPDDHARAGNCWQDAVARGSDYEIEYRLRHHADGYRWVLARGEPMRDDQGKLIRWLGTCTDIHATKAAHQQMEVLSRELSHRIKNIFAVIGGLVGLTIRRRPEFAPIGRELQERVLALGRAHDFVRPQSDASRRDLPHTSLTGMLGELLAPYRHDGRARVRIHGGDIAIDDRSATPLALAFHELATNAAKYGALSTLDGAVAIGIAHESGSVVMTWEETGGPPVPQTVTNGFGSSLIDLSLRLQLGGTVVYDRRPQGLRVVARVPLGAMSRD